MNFEPTLSLSLLQHSAKFVNLGRELCDPGGQEGGAVAVGGRGGRSRT